MARSDSSSLKKCEPRILITGKHFSGRGLRAIGPVLEEIIDSANSEIQILAYLLSKSAIPLIQRLVTAVQKGISVTLIVNRIESQPSYVHSLLRALAQYQHADVISFSPDDKSQLHAKVVVVDRKVAIVGSANLTFGGMVANHEVAVLVEGQPAWVLGDFIARLGAEIRHPATSS